MTDSQGRKKLIATATRHAHDLGVGFIVEWQDEQERLTFVVRRCGGAPGSGARAICYLLDLADKANLPVVIDVIDSIPALVRYYWQFGFRAFGDDEAGERSGLAQMESERAEIAARTGRPINDFGVLFMWREQPASMHQIAA